MNMDAIEVHAREPLLLATFVFRIPKSLEKIKKKCFSLKRHFHRYLRIYFPDKTTDSTFLSLV